MTRKSDDLLELFRPGPAPKRASSASTSVRSRAGGGGGVVVALSRRQALLVASAGVLVVVLAFTAGIGIGRGRRAPEGAPAAARLTSTPHVLLSAPIPRVGLRGEDLLPLVVADLVSKHPEFERRIQVVAPSDPRARESGARCLLIRGFPDRDTAQAVQFQLAVWGMTGAGFPFQTSAPTPER